MYSRKQETARRFRFLNSISLYFPSLPPIESFLFTKSVLILYLITYLLHGAESFLRS